jgi:hypothetical protein
MDTPLSQSLTSSILTHLTENHPLSTLSEKPTLAQLSALITSLTSKDPRIKPHPLMPTLTSLLKAAQQIQTGWQAYISSAKSTAHRLGKIELMLAEYKNWGVVVEEAELVAGMVERTKEMYARGEEKTEIKLVEMEEGRKRMAKEIEEIGRK